MVQTCMQLWMHVSCHAFLVFARVAAQSEGHFFLNRDTSEVMPLPPASYPEHLQGILWMDQAGYISESGISPLSDGVVSLDGALDTKTRTQCVNTCSTSWSWFNTAESYSALTTNPNDMDTTECWYTFYWNENYTKATIAGVDLGNLPAWAVTMTMELQEPPPDAVCTSPQRADRETNMRCAKWVRKNFALGLPFSISNYYVFEVVDKDRHPTEYYDLYLQFANSRSHPDLTQLKKYNISGDLSTVADTSFIGPPDRFDGSKVLPGSCPLNENRGDAKLEQYLLLSFLILCVVFIMIACVWGWLAMCKCAQTSRECKEISEEDGQTEEDVEKQRAQK